MHVMRPGTEPGEGGHAVGRDPRTMTRQELEALGHAAVSPLAALRARCVDCCAGAVSEVRRCRQTICPSWPFRMGSDPWKEPTDAQLAARRTNAAKARAAKTKAIPV
jgi:hypothetical protein